MTHDEVTCPYCGHIETDRWDCVEEGNEIIVKCASCNSKYKVFMRIVVSYLCHKDCDLNNEPHRFRKIRNFHNDKFSRVCSECSARTAPQLIKK